MLFTSQLSIGQKGKGHTPHIVPAVGKGSKAGCEDLEELEENGDFWLVCFQSILLQRALAALCIFFAQFNGHISLSQALRRRVLCNSVAVAGVAVHTNTLPVLPRAFITILAGAEVSVSLLELSVQPDDGHGVGGVAVVAPHGSVTSFAHAVTNLGQVELVQQVLVETGVLVDCVVLGVAMRWRLRWSVAELNLVVEVDLSGSSGEAVALLRLLVVLRLNMFGGCRRN